MAERPDRNPSYDAQRTAANTNDLRGKILRIHPEDDGSYTIPEGNLFGPGGEHPGADPAKVRPEIYAMGFRNPFRFGIDEATGWLYVGEYGPDAATADEFRGPGGLVEVNQIREAGNYGWSEPAFQQSLVSAIDWLAGVRPDSECLDAGAPLPAGPQPHDPERKQVGKPCPVPAMRETNATEDFRAVRTWDAQDLNGGLPGNFVWGAQTWVVDLSPSRSATADVTIDLDWDLPTDDYDLSVTTAWGYYGSDNPLGAVRERVVIDDVPHCAILQVAGDNMLAPSRSGTTARISVAPHRARPAR